MAHPQSPSTEEVRTHAAPGSRYLVVWVALVVLTTLTLVLSRVDLPPPWHLLVALLIACAKSSLVVLFFMHLWDQPGANRLVFATSLVFVALLIGLVVADNATRFPLANPPHEATLKFEPPAAEVPAAEPRDGEPAPGSRAAPEAVPK